MANRRYQLARLMLMMVAALALPGASPMASPVPDRALFATPWIDGTDVREPQTQIQALDADTFVIRQSLRTNFEGPFLYLLFGRDRALLIDTGAGGMKIRPAIDRIMARWLAAHRRRAIPLVVAHSHGHRDHIAGDAEFRDRPDTAIVGLRPVDVARYFDIRRWPYDAARFDLGGRALTILATPGHQTAHIMVYDPRLRLLLSGDALYPGRIYIPVNHLAEMRASIDRVAAFTRRHPVRAILGAHIEMTRTPGRDYPQSAAQHAREHRLELPITALTELRRGLRAELAVPEKPHVHRDFIIYPMPWRAD